MNKVSLVIEQESTLYLLEHIHKTPQITQRKLSNKLDISLGKINFLIKELSKKGWLKAKRATHSDNKLAYVYLLTPKGIKRKAELTKWFLKRKIEEYNQLEREIDLLKEKIGGN